MTNKKNSTQGKDKGKDLGKNLAELSAIADWFDEQEEVDIEAGLKQVKKAATLIKASKKRLRQVENDFTEIKREIEEEINEDEDVADG